MHVYNAHRGQLSLHMPRALIVDNFAGGGGASMGLEQAFQRPVDIAINHNEQAISMHQVNHPDTEHYCESVWDVDPVKATHGLPVEWAHFSPDCTHHSKARGGKPKDKDIRGLAWVALKWALLKRPEKISIENVEEFRTWGPPTPEKQPCPENKGQLFDAFIKGFTTGLSPMHNITKHDGLRTNHSTWHEAVTALGIEHNPKMKLALKRGLNYSIDWTELRACDYGAPTTRKRFFMVARADGQAINWPEPTHGPGLTPYRSAAECIDWSIPAPSIFERKRPLAENTLRRIARGLQKYVIEAERPFVVNEVAPFITEHANASSQRNMPADEPLRTICAQVKGGHFALVTAFMVKHYGGNYTGPGIDMRQPLDTITTVDHHAVCVAWLLKYYGTNIGTNLNDPMQTITTRDRFGLVTCQIDGETYQIVDIGMRMLEPHELYKAQGFPDGYIHSHDHTGKPFTKTAQVRMVGNSVPPCLIEAIAKANTEDAAEQPKRAAA